MLKLEGSLSGPWVDEVEKCWAERGKRSRRTPVRVDLQELSYVDSRGRDLLIQMEREGASLVEASDFIWHLIKDNRTSERQDSARPRQKQQH